MMKLQVGKGMTREGAGRVELEAGVKGTQGLRAVDLSFSIDAKRSKVGMS